jgi:hypothetical protein
MNRTIRKSTALFVLGCSIAIAAGPSAGASVQTDAKGAITVRCAEALRGEITDGSVAGTGHFTISGAVNDRGRVTDYRKVVGSTALIRRVAAGRKGTLVFLIKINLNTGAEPWTISSGTKRYKGLHGKGTQVVDNYLSTPAVFKQKGTVWR